MRFYKNILLVIFGITFLSLPLILYVTMVKADCGTGSTFNCSVECSGPYGPEPCTQDNCPDGSGIPGGCDCFYDGGGGVCTGNCGGFVGGSCEGDDEGGGGFGGGPTPTPVPSSENPQCRVTTSNNTFYQGLSRSLDFYGWDGNNNLIRLTGNQVSGSQILDHTFTARYDYVYAYQYTCTTPGNVTFYCGANDDTSLSCSGNSAIAPNGVPNDCGRADVPPQRDSLTINCIGARIQGVRVDGCPAGSEIRLNLTKASTGDNVTIGQWISPAIPLPSEGLTANYNDFSTYAGSGFKTTDTLDFGGQYTLNAQLQNMGTYVLQYSNVAINNTSHSTYTTESDNNATISITLPSLPAASDTGYADVRFRCEALPQEDLVDIQARSVIVPASYTCAQIAQAADEAGNTSSTSFTVDGYAQNPFSPQSSNGPIYASWTDRSPDSYSLDFTTPPNLVARTCLTTNGGINWSANQSTYTNTPGVTNVRWEVGYSRISGWFETMNGDVYSYDDMVSELPLTSPLQKKFILNGAGGQHGVAIYGGNDYDFSWDTNNEGNGPTDNYLSDNRYLANDRYQPFYQYYYERYQRMIRSPVAPEDVSYFSSLADLVPDNNMTTIKIYNGDLSIGIQQLISGSNKKAVVFVNGNLYINNTIQVDAGNFLAFIVSGNINVDPSVGGAPTDITTTTRGHIEGIYLVNGTFDTNTNNGNDLQLIGRGAFVAGTFSLERDLGLDNTSYPGEAFIHNPELLILMPEDMLRVPVKIQGVAPRQ